ncbi:MAG: alkaline phosphatase family protein [Planctomycetes bacterium]|nr:alkaline phosphatase family protein [Planctomycetota bacterium]
MKLLFIGLDGLSFDIFEEFPMPFLHDMSDEGVRAKFMSFDDPYMCTGPVWTSVQTGIRPEEHGVTEPGAAGWHTAAFKDNVKTIWRRMNEKGLSCGLINYPVTYPLRPVDPFVVCGFPAPWEHEGTQNPWDEVQFGGELFWPPELKEHVGGFRSAWMNYIPPEEYEDTHEPYRAAQEGDPESRNYIMALLHRSLHETARLAHILLRRYEVDVGVSIFMETDTLGHLGSAVPAVRREEFLHEVDNVVRELVLDCNPDNVIVMSDHGCWGQPHVKEGIFLAFGPAFGAGVKAEVEVLDVAPTILYLMGVYEPTLPREPAYRVLKSGQVEEEAQGKIQDRLRAMGYLE